MEAYYHNDPRIQEWVEQIIETIFTTCLLSGKDSETEYQKGCKTVGKLSSLLQGFSTFPSEYLADGLKQIIEQQLPDPRVISNFSTFIETMNRMLNEGMLKAMGDIPEESKIIEMPESIPASASICQNQVLIKEGDESEVLIEEKDEKTDTASGNFEVINSMDKLQECIESDIKSDIKSDTSNKDSRKIVSISAKASELVQTAQIPYRAERLNDVLSYIFPKAPVLWNVSLLNQEFLAQVEDVLISCYDSARPSETNKYVKDGWRILVLREDDLSYPRRLEREVRTILRLGRKS
ncbi:hypothetical protein [Desulfosporosinus lacus]|uniref:Uncharacterized protein n=1 Tax=Desulfosporosinus lacus DSM 15449 TaxID=1121420 RepID=A0A1M5W9Y9_9FIRM|nr:hypothetical protein [Desulfosporosinus lacus]SHH84023.1 hypothetical protein SAMN02746098_01508 [Desulfosporosinus lacus DSM 15449]